MLWSCIVVAALSAAPSSSPTEVVKRGNQAVQGVLASRDASAERLAHTVDGFVDFGELAKRALGKEWSRLSRRQQQDFSSTMRGLLRASYAQRALGQGKAEIEYAPERREDNEVDVPTLLQVKKDKIPVVYRLYLPNAREGWKIFDVVTDDVSLLDTYRTQFRKLIANRGVEGLLTTLKNKRAQLERSFSASANSR
jgi:phospholipid transport system substrate-binding protein